MFSTVAAQRGFANHSIIASTKAAIEGLAMCTPEGVPPVITEDNVEP